jgi:hypothetical protein
MLSLRFRQDSARTHDYRRHGVVDLYAALELRTGKLVGDCRESHTARDFLSFLKSGRGLLQYPHPPFLFDEPTSLRKSAVVRHIVKFPEAWNETQRPLSGPSHQKH